MTAGIVVVTIITGGCVIWRYLRTTRAKLRRYDEELERYAGSHAARDNGIAPVGAGRRPATLARPGHDPSQPGNDRHGEL